jgi:hypothetical protein
LLGLYRLLQGTRPLAPVVRVSLGVLFVALFATGFGSAYFPLESRRTRLWWANRLPMTVVFAGVFGAMLAERISSRSGDRCPAC